jgi:hypothetical protein
MARPIRRLYDLSENVVPAQGAEAIADTPAAESATDSTSGERNETQTDPTSLDSNPYNEQGTRTPDHRVDVTTLAQRRQIAKRSVPPRLSNTEFSDVIRRIDRVSVSNPESPFSQAVVAGAQSFAYAHNRNALNVMAAVLPILIKSGNFDLNDRNDLLKLNQRVATLRRQADGSFLVQADQSDPTAGGDSSSVDSAMQQQMGGGSGGSSSGGGDQGILGDLGSGDFGGALGDLGTDIGNTIMDPASALGLGTGPLGPDAGAFSGPDSSGSSGGGSQVDGAGYGPVDPSKPETGPMGSNPSTNPAVIDKIMDPRTARIARNYLREIRAGRLSLSDLTPRAAAAVRRLADDSSSSGPSYDPFSGTDSGGASLSGDQSSAVNSQAGMGGYDDPAADSSASGMGDFPASSGDGTTENAPMAGGLGGTGLGDAGAGAAPTPAASPSGADAAATATDPGAPQSQAGELDQNQTLSGPGGAGGDAGQIGLDTASNPNAGGDAGAGGDTTNPGGVAGWAQDVAQGAGNAWSGLGNELGDIGSGISDAVSNLGDIPNAVGQGFQNGQQQATSSRKGKAMDRLDARTARIASRYAKLMLAGVLSYKDLNPKAQQAVSAWMRTADDDSGSGDDTTDNGKGTPGKDENDKDNRQNPHGDPGNDEGMLSNPDQGEYGQVSTDANPGGPPVENVPDNIKNSNRRRRLHADDNMDVAQKDTDSVDVEAPVSNDTSDDAQASQYDRGDYDQNGPILGEGGAPDADKSTDQNWPPKASAVDSIRLADMYVDLGLIPAEKKYEVVAGFEDMSSIIVKDRLRVLAVVAENLRQQGNRRQANSANGRTRSMVPQSGNSNGTGSNRMPQFGRASSIKGNTNNGIDTHFLAL